MGAGEATALETLDPILAMLNPHKAGILAIQDETHRRQIQLTRDSYSPLYWTKIDPNGPNKALIWPLANDFKEPSMC